MRPFTVYSKTIRSNKERTSLVELEKLIDQFKTDEKKRSLVETFRAGRLQFPPASIRQILDRLPLICPGKSARRHRDGHVSVSYNGVVLLEISDLPSPSEALTVKQRVKGWPTTLAAITGADGLSVVVLVAGTLEDGTLPTDDELCTRFHQRLYDSCAQVYTTLIGLSPRPKNASMDDSFRWTADDNAYYNPLAVPVRISRRECMSASIDADAHEYAPDSEQPSPDSVSYYRRRFSLAVLQAREALSQRSAEAGSEAASEPSAEALLSATALQALQLGIPQEECVRQALWNSLFMDLAPGLSRAIIESTYAENSPAPRAVRSHPLQTMAAGLHAFFQKRYDLRFNVLSNGVEWRRNDSASFVFQPLDTRVMNTMIQECHEAGLEVFDRDMKRYLGSSRIRDYNAAHTYLRDLKPWDRQTDYIGQMADRVPTDTPQWRERFHTWFLGMVAQWDGWNISHGNAVVPLLVGAQGCGKSTFGQLLLPPELRDVGYRELVDFSSKQDAERLLCSSLLINLDEFNQISEKIQQGFLKNLIQKTSVKGRRPYSSVTLNMPRFASFIATTNMADVLSDPSGSRRFIIAEIKDGRAIDLSAPIPYQGMYAQAQAELADGRRPYFTAEEVTAIEADNVAFTSLKPEVRRFLDVFQPAKTRDKDTVALRLTELVNEIRRQTGFTYSDRGFNYIGRWLTTESKVGRIRKTLHNGSPVYLVKRNHPLNNN